MGCERATMPLSVITVLRPLDSESVVSSCVIMDSLSVDPQWVPGEIVAGKLRIVRQLGAGGMGTVYEVEHVLTRHRRALKLLHAQMAQIPSVVERFLREASAAGRIGNAHIVETFDAGRLESGQPFIVMELLHGKTLAEKLAQSGALKFDAICEILAQSCNAMSAAHATGIVHRDLKPENLFLSGPEQSFVKILDFGISKFDAAATKLGGLTLQGLPLGTPSYMSPEQVQGDGLVDLRTDVYALGVVLYECLTNSKPFVGNTLPELVTRIVQGKFAMPSEKRSGLPKQFDEIVKKAMAKNRGDRYPNTEQLAVAIAALANSLNQVSLDRTEACVADELLETQIATHTVTPNVFSHPATSPMRVAQGQQRTRSVLTVIAALVLVAAGAIAWLRVASRGVSSSGTPSERLTNRGTMLLESGPPASVVAPEVASLPMPSHAPVLGSSLPQAKRLPVANARTKVPENRAKSYGMDDKNPFM